MVIKRKKTRFELNDVLVAGQGNDNSDLQSIIAEELVEQEKNFTTEEEAQQARRRSPTLRNLKWYREQDLAEIVIVSKFYSLFMSQKLLLPVGVLLCICFLEYYFSYIPIEIYFIKYILYIFTITCSLVLIATMTYWEIYRKSLKILISGFNLKVERGITRKERSVVTISPFITVFLHQSPFELIIL
jgi:hypothetical protein